MSTLIGAALSFALLALVFGALERAFPARAGQRVLRAAYGRDVCFFFGQYLVFAGLAIAALSAVTLMLDARLPAWLLETRADLPLAVKGMLAIALGDVGVYWFHRACHRVDWLWRVHSVHHSSEELDWLAAHREHPIDGVLTQLAQNLPAILLGFPVEVLYGLVVFRGLWAIFIHSNVALPLGPLRVLFGAPELHHHHHARVRETRHNFANLAPWVDKLFGTYHLPPSPKPYALGLEAPHPKGYLAQLAHPFGLGFVVERAVRRGVEVLGALWVGGRSRSRSAEARSAAASAPSG